MIEIYDDTELNETDVETAEEISTREGIYGEIKRLLIARGIPANEIAFIHDFPTPARKAQAFAIVRAVYNRAIIPSGQIDTGGANEATGLYSQPGVQGGAEGGLLARNAAQEVPSLLRAA